MNSRRSSDLSGSDHLSGRVRRGVFLLPVLLTCALAAPLLGARIAWIEHPVSGFYDGADSVYAADVDGDGDVDVLGRARSNVNWWENVSGDGSDWVEHTIDGDFDGAESVVTADIDGDNDLDVLATAGSVDGWGNVTWWENTAGDGTAWTEHTIDDDFVRAHTAIAADLDGDGDADVLAAADNEVITWFENTAGNGTVWVARPVDDAFSNFISICAADLDGDGDQDVAGGFVSFDEVLWWENSIGDGTEWMEQAVYGEIAVPYSTRAGDMDGDGDMDVLIGTKNGIVWRENEFGDGTSWLGHPVYDPPQQPFFVDAIAADLDGDGDSDVLASLDRTDEVAWWENTLGDGTTWVDRKVGGLAGPNSVFAADVDGDGDLDALASAHDADTIVWWENLGPAPFLGVAGECAGDIRVELVAATGSSTIALLGSASEGASSVPAGRPCAGTSLGLATPSVLTTFTTDSNGDHTIQRSVGEGACGLFLQALDLVTCETTSVEQVP